MNVVLDCQEGTFPFVYYVSPDFALSNSFSHCLKIVHQLLYPNVPDTDHLNWMTSTKIYIFKTGS